MTTTITLNVNPYAMKDITAKKAMTRIIEVSKIIEKFQTEQRPIARTELERFVHDNFNPDLLTTATTILKVFEANHWVMCENRKEETIKVKGYGWVYTNAKGEIIPERVKATLANGQKIMVSNPECIGLRPIYKECEREIQITRKYYTWVA